MSVSFLFLMSALGDQAAAAQQQQEREQQQHGGTCRSRRPSIFVLSGGWLLQAEACFFTRNRPFWHPKLKKNLAAGAGHRALEREIELRTSPKRPKPEIGLLPLKFGSRLASKKRTIYRSNRLLIMSNRLAEPAFKRTQRALMAQAHLEGRGRSVQRHGGSRKSVQSCEVRINPNPSTVIRFFFESGQRRARGITSP